MAESAMVVQQQTATIVVEVQHTHVVEVIAPGALVEQSGASGAVVQLSEAAIVTGMQAGALVVQPVMSTEVVAVGIQGPAGRAGPIGPAGGSALQRVAGHAVSALRVVWEDEFARVHYLSSSDESHIFSLLGVTLSAADAGAMVNVQRSGVMDDASWGWISGQRVFLGRDGGLTQTPEEEGFHVVVGTAVSATRLLLGIVDPVDLGECPLGD